MKKIVYLKKIAVCFVVFIIALSLFSVSAFATDSDRQSIESDSVIQYQLMLTEFKHQKLNGLILSDYPDYYAGAYINSNGELVILLTNTKQDKIEAVKAFTRNSKINTVAASYSYNELVAQKNSIFYAATSLCDQIIDYRNPINDDLLKLKASFVGVGVDEEKNQVVVCLTDISDANISAFRKYISDYKNVYFELSGPAEEQATTMNAGRWININGGTGSIGYRSYVVQSDGTVVYGFTTAGHNSSYVGQSVYGTVDGDVCGSVLKRQYSGTVDATFVKLLNGYSVSNVTVGGAVLSNTWFTSIPQGKTVYMCGKGSLANGNATLEGTVKNNSFSFSSEGSVYLSDQLRISYGGNVPKAGDSGGIVYAVSGSSNAIVGIHHGVCSLAQGLDGRGIATKANNIHSVLGVVPY